jgi:O-antigen ligase
MTTALSSDPAGGMHKLIRWALFLAFFCLVVQLVDGRPEIDRALRVFALSVGAAGAYTLYLFIGGGHGYRAAGPLEDPNDLAYLIACTLPIMAYLFKSEPRRRLLWGACFVLGTGAMLSTFSRGALVGVSALVVWGIVTRRIPFRALAAGILTGLILVTLAFTIWKPFFDEALHQKEHIADHNIESRESRWAAAIQLGGESPVLGIGTGLYPVKSLPILRDDTGYLPEVTVPQTVAHNSYLEIFAENGLPGLVLFVAYLVVAWMLLRKSRRLALAAGDERVGWLVTALQSSLVIAIVAGSFLSEELTSPYWLLGALAAVLAGSFEEAPATGTVEAAPTVEAGEPRQLPYAPGLPAGTAA